MSREIVLVQPVRTAIGAYNGALKGTPATDLGAVVVRETLARSGVDLSQIGGVVMGNVIQAGNRMNPARQAVLVRFRTNAAPGSPKLAACLMAGARLV